ncbi:MAG: efflux transporter outer membrane subunit [Desulfotignum sp.]|jgi:NodT family efflux transporter outer membrane factor (OMF) lipoprotein|nr:efflux transporter outer membrane subunit [Desulfotignum sp.]
MARSWPGKRVTVLTALFLAAVLIFPGCSVIKPDSRTLENLPASVHTASSETLDFSLASPWWEQFNSRELNQLVTRALTHNFTIREARARLDQAASRADAAKADALPLITLETRYNRTQTDQDTTSFNTFSLGPAAAYEVDLWGRINAGVTSSALAARATASDLETAAMTIAAEVARTWVDLITAREQLARVKKQLEVNTTVRNLLELRFEKSMSSALDILQQREVVAQTQAKIPPLENRIQQLKASVHLLLGQTSGTGLTITGDLPEALPELPHNGLPANLLVLRPDVRAQGLRLLAADWDAAAARAYRLPDLVLTGNFLFQDNALDLLLDNWILTLGARLAGTVFDGGQKKALSRQAAAVVKERLAAYEKVVHTAIAEVETSLAAEKHQAAHIFLLTAQLETARQALAEARRRYIKGLDPFIPFLTEQLNVQELEIRLLEQTAVLIKNRITLYRALGGDWQTIVSPMPKETP